MSKKSTKASLRGRSPATMYLTIIALISAVAVGAAAMAFTTSGDKAKPGTTPAADSPASNGPAVCTEKQVSCGEITADGLGPVSYAIIRRSTQGAPLVLFEAGGPGVDILARVDRDHLGLPSELDKADVLLIDEPWTHGQPGAECAQAVKSFGTAVVQPGSVALPMGSRCNHLTWTSSTYTAALRQILAKETRKLSGIVGQSFGALPAAAAAKAYPDVWLVLNAPIAPPSTLGTDLMAERGRALREALDASYADVCSDLKIDCSKTGLDVVTQAGKRLQAQEVSGRVGLRPGDIGVAAMSAAYGLGMNERWLWKALTDIPNITANTTEQLARMADQVLQRYGSGEISTDMAAFVLGTCRSFAGWPNQTHESASEPERLLTELERQCGQLPSHTQWESSTIPNRHAPVCILGNTSDPVSPAEWADRWTTTFPQAVVSHYRYKGHANLYEMTKATHTQISCLAAAS